MYNLTRQWIVVWFYFSTTSFFWFHIDGVFPQGLAILFAMLILGTKDWRIQIGLIGLATLTHSHGFHLGLIAFISNQLWLLFKHDIQKKGKFTSKIKDKFMKVFLGCSGIFGNAGPKFLEERIVINFGDISKPLGGGAYPLQIVNILALFTKIFPLPLWLISLYYYIKSKQRWDLVLMVLLVLMAGTFFSTSSHRVFYVIPLLLLPGLTWFYNKTRKRNKAVILLFSVGVFIIQVWSWVNIRGCFA